MCLLQGASDYVIQNWKKYIFMILFTSDSGTTTVLLVKETLRGAAIIFKNVSKVEQYICTKMAHHQQLQTQ